MKAAFALVSMGRTLLLAVFAAALAMAGFAYWEHSRRVRSTDNAYINAEVIQISSLVAGPVVAVHVQENQYVRKGDRLFDVDPKPFLVAVKKARAQVGLARQGSRQDLAEVLALDAELAKQNTDLAAAEISQRRAESLVAKGFMSRQAVDDAAARVAASRALVDQAKARLEKARAALAQHDDPTPAIAAMLANLEQSELDLERTRAVAPQDGWVVNKTLTAGTSVAPGQPLFAIIKDKSFWVDANFKETELPGLKPGQIAEIGVDMYPGQRFRGHIESLGGGTGTAFSLLPPQNATGNWVKVTQRIPVKVRLDDFDSQFRLRVGATATVTVHLD